MLQPLSVYQEYPPDEMECRARMFRQDLERRRSVRDFSDRSVSKKLIENLLLTAGTAPSGANMQPWHFVAVSDPQIKAKIRIGAEREEKEFYNGKAPKEWVDALAPLGTNEKKPFLEVAPWLITIFVQRYGVLDDGRKIKNYYALESVGIATGLLITAVQNAGLVSLTHTPSPMNFLNRLLNRPINERPFLILVVGYPAEDAQIPVISKKSIKDIATYL
tara:strand:+ start:18781 stop:19437 length:657 start_codon:yes stop_codon:yes gene_type:complete